MHKRESWRARLAAALLFLLAASPGAGQEGSPAGPVPPEALQTRRDRLLALLEGAPALLSGAAQRSLHGDYPQDSDFRQSNDFFYLTGLEVPGAWLFLNGPEGEDAVLYLPPRSPRAERWTGPVLGPGPEAGERTGIREVRSTELLERDLRRWAGARAGGRRGSAAPLPLFLSLGSPRHRSALEPFLPRGGDEPRDLAPLLARLRLVKDAEEIRRLRRAVEVTMEAHREVWRVARPGLREYEMEAVLEYVFRVQGAERAGFPSIVGSGPNSVILHYDKNRRTMEEGELVVVDIGAEFGYYTADLTRTIPVGGSFTPRQKALYDLVLGAQEAALRVVRPGTTILEMNTAARAHLREHSGALCGDASCEPYFIHGLSHWLGMDVHDVGDASTPLAPGMVLTVEPGIYLAEEGLGIRIEDNVLVTDTGHGILSRALPGTTEEIEAIMAQEPRWVRPLPVGNEAPRR